MFYIIYQTAFIGDIILSTSMLKTIKEADPEAKIIVITTPLGEEILANNNDIHDLLIYDKRNRNKGYRGLIDIVSRIDEIMGNDKSVFFSPHRYMRASIIGFMTGSKIRVGFGNSALSFLYNHHIPYRLGIHEIERNHELLTAYFGDMISERKPEMPRLFPSEDDFFKAKDLIFSVFQTDKNLISIAPGSIWPTKRWPLKYFEEVIGLLDNNGIRVILIGGKEDYGICKGLESGKVLNLAGKLSILESAAVISSTRAIITNDSAPLHIASAMNTPTIAIFGATTPYLGFGPLADRSAIIENSDIDCRPCGRHGGRSCRYKHFECMKSIDPGMVFDSVMKTIE